MSELEAARLAHQAASRAHVAKNALRADVGLTNLAASLERLSQAVALLAEAGEFPALSDGVPSPGPASAEGLRYPADSTTTAGEPTPA